MWTKQDILQEIAAQSRTIAKLQNEYELTSSCEESLKLLLLKLADLKRKVQTLQNGEPRYSGDYTLEEIGKRLGNISRERIRQIESSAIKKIRNPNYGKHLLEYVRM
jgi:RNA polymerase primary sigma factor